MKYKLGSPIIKLANESGGDPYRPSWVPIGTDPIEITHALMELGYCMEDTPAPFEWGDIVSAEMTELEDYEGEDDEPGEPTYPSGYGDRSYVWDVILKDGRRYAVEGWHDYTGWGCQSGATYTEVVS